MVNLEKFIESFDLKEVVRALKNTYECAETVLLWQSVNGENRHIRDAFVEKIDIKKQSIVFNCALDSETFNFTKDEELYVRLTHRSLIFKVKIKRSNEQYVEVELPSSYRIIENRANQRFRPLDLPVTIEKKEEVIGQTRFELIGIDTSLRGLGLSLSVTKIRMFNIGDQLYLKKIGTYTFSTPLICRVAHITCLEDESIMTAKDYKLGLEIIDQDLPDNIFKMM